MKPAKFDYVLAGSTDEVAAALTAGGGETMVLAGGQTLMPLLAMRLARPAVLVDINDVAELAGIEPFDGEIVIRACTRQADALASPVVRDAAPLLAMALGHVGHQQTRNRGTVGGSLTHGDPSAEIPLAALALDAEVELVSSGGSRRVAVNDFYTGPMMTVREPDELLVSLHLPLRRNGARVGNGFHEVAERHGDFAIAAAAAHIELDAHGSCVCAAVAVGGIDDVPRRFAVLEDALVGGRIEAARVRDAVAAITDGSAQRRRIARHLAERAVLDAAAQAAAA